jgi:hypothetical protein
MTRSLAGMALVLVAVAVTAAACEGHSPGTRAEPSPSAIPAGPSGSGSTAPASGPTGSAGVPPVGACRPADLDPRPWYGGEGAMGSAFRTILVRNAGPVPCRLSTYPALWDSGRAAAVPADPKAATQPVVTLAPDRYAAFTIRTANGYAGLDPSSPQCAHPQDLRNLSVVVDGDLRYPLPGFTLSYQCGRPEVGPWTAYDRSPQTLPNASRAPAG